METTTASGATTTTPLLTARNLVAGYGKQQVLSDVSLHVHAGEVVTASVGVVCDMVLTSRSRARPVRGDP